VALPQNEELATKHGKLNEALENLLTLEKQCRLSNDVDSVCRIVTSIVTLLKNKPDWKLLNEHILLLAKRRGQHKKAVTAVVQESMKFLDDLSGDEPTLLALIDTLRTVTEGKIFVELERARLTRRLADIKEKNGEKQDACDTLNEVQVETYGSMERREKAEFVLEQMRLLLDCGDLIRANMVAKKLSEKLLNDPDFEDVKINYNTHMVRYHTEKANYMDIFRCWHNIYRTDVVKNDSERCLSTLRIVVGFLVLSQHDNEQHDMLHRIIGDEHLEKLPACKSLLKLLTTQELITWANVEAMKSELWGGGENQAWEGERSETRWSDLKKRCTEHNIRVIAANYTRITMPRLQSLLQLGPDETEEFLCDMVTSKSLWARIDRPAGIIVFKPNKKPNELLNEWSTDITSLLDIMEKCTHLIYKENIAHKIK